MLYFYALTHKFFHLNSNKINPKKIYLIVDDDTDDSEFLCGAINEIDESSQCLTAHNGEDALKKLRNGTIQRPDLIFLDLNMPRMGGRQCLVELKNDEKLKDIPVIIYSTASTQNYVNETLKLGAVYFLVKPTDLKDLRNQISVAMQTDW